MILRLFDPTPVVFERATESAGRSHPSKVRVSLVACEPVTVWAPSWDGCPFQRPLTSGLETGGRRGDWTGKTLESTFLATGDTVRCWVALDPLVPDDARVGVLTVPCSSREGWQELHFPIGLKDRRPFPGAGSARLG